MVIRYVHSADEPSDVKKLFIVHIESISKKQYIGLIKFQLNSILLGRFKQLPKLQTILLVITVNMLLLLLKIPIDKVYYHLYN